MISTPEFGGHEGGVARAAASIGNPLQHPPDSAYGSLPPIIRTQRSGQFANLRPPRWIGESPPAKWILQE
jgi:hypothetical protein